MKTLLQAMACVLFAALAVLAVSAALLVRTATAVVAALPGELECTRNRVLAEVRAARQDALARSERQIAALRSDVAAEAGRIRETADRRIGDTLGRADAALGTVESLRADLKPTLEATHSLVKNAEASWDDLYWDVKASLESSASSARAVAEVAANIDQISREFRGTLPRMLVTWNQIGADVSATAGNLNRLTKPHWYDRLLGYGLNGVVLYRNLNPATSLTVKGAQVISSRP